MDRMVSPDSMRLIHQFSTRILMLVRLYLFFIWTKIVAVAGYFK